jgi:hypothetical protein
VTVFATHLGTGRKHLRAQVNGCWLDEARVYSYNLNASDNFQVYHSNVAVLPRPPGSCTPATRPGINGLTCPIAPLTEVAPAAPTNLRIVIAP